MAIDGVTGKKLWEYPWPAADDADGSAGNAVPGVHKGVRAANLAQRLWEDSAYGQLSSDGRLLFLLDNLGPAAGGSPAVAMLLFNRLRGPVLRARRQPLAPTTAGTRLETGRGKSPGPWAGGPVRRNPGWKGSSSSDRPCPTKAGCTCWARSSDEVSLYVLNAASGRLLWSQLVALPLRDVFSDPVRRLAGAALTLADGVLVLSDHQRRRGCGRSGHADAAVGLRVPGAGRPLCQRPAAASLGSGDGGACGCRRGGRRRPRDRAGARRQAIASVRPGERSAALGPPPRRPALRGLHRRGQGGRGGGALGAGLESQRRDAGMASSPCNAHADCAQLVRPLWPATFTGCPRSRHNSCKSTCATAASSAASRPRARWATWSPAASV